MSTTPASTQDTKPSRRHSRWVISCISLSWCTQATNVDDAPQEDELLARDALISEDWRNRIAAGPKEELTRKITNRKTNADKYARLAYATRLKKADPNFDFKTANPIDAETSSRRSSKRVKRSRDESDDDEDEDEDSQLQILADQDDDETEAEDATLVSDDHTQTDILTEADDDAHAIAQQNNDQAHGQDHQPAGGVPMEDQANNHSENMVYQGGHQVQASIDPADTGVHGVPPQQQDQLPMERATFPTRPNQLAMMQQQNSFRRPAPQAS